MILIFINSYFLQLFLELAQAQGTVYSLNTFCTSSSLTFGTVLFILATKPRFLSSLTLLTVEATFAFAKASSIHV